MLRLSLAAVAVVVALGCGARRDAPLGFDFERDTFAFANETLWSYRVDAASGAMAWSRREPAPAFVLRCGNMARAARQFRLHARFEPAAPPVADSTYATLVGRVLARDARAAAPSEDPVAIPGYAGLRGLSAAHAAVLQEALGGSWRSYLQRGNWRMIFPFTAAHQRKTAARLADEVAAGRLPIVHVLRYPQLDINHVLLLYGAAPDAAGVRFLAYDPNDAGRPLELAWDAGAGQFTYPRTDYFLGGPVRVYEIYDGWLG